MSTLTEIKNHRVHYYTDDRRRTQGECKEWWENGHQREHCYYKDDELHGEYKWWWMNGQLKEHSFYKNYNDITAQVKALVDDISNITKEERMLIKLKFGIECLS